MSCGVSIFFVDMLCRRSQNAAYRGASDVEPTCDLGLGNPFAIKLPHLATLPRRRWRPSQALPVLSGMSQSGANPLAQDLAFELGEYGQQTGHGPTGGRGQVQRFGQRNETDAEMFQFPQSAEQVGDRASPTIQSPHQHGVDLATARGLQQLLTKLTLGSSGADLPNLHDNAPASSCRVLPHGTALKWQSLLVVGGHAGVETSSARSFPPASPLAKNPVRIGLARGPFSGHFRVAPAYGRNRWFAARRDSSYATRNPG